MAARMASGVTVSSCSITALPMLTSARSIPSTPAREVNTARTQCAQLIPEIEAVVCIGHNIVLAFGDKVELRTTQIRSHLCGSQLQLESIQSSRFAGLGTGGTFFRDTYVFSRAGRNLSYLEPGSQSTQPS